MKLFRAIFFVLLCCTSSAALAERRVALVIGNDTYASVGHLNNPVRDARAISNSLRVAGFEVVQLRTNLGRKGIIQALEAFEKHIERSDWALFYFAGHGIEMGGMNYIIPIDARLSTSEDVSREAVSLLEIQKYIKNTSKLRIIILDACRNNPFLDTMKLTGSPRAAETGLVPAKNIPGGSVVAYSADIGQIASDGEPEHANSPYAASLMRYLSVPNLEINQFFRKVRSNVLKVTDNRQKPIWVESLPDEKFVLRPPSEADEKFDEGPPLSSSQIPHQSNPLKEGNRLDRKYVIEKCDRLSSQKEDADRPASVRGVEFSNIDVPAATDICRSAAKIIFGEDLPIKNEIVASRGKLGSREYKEIIEKRRILFQLGRSLDASKSYDEAKIFYEKSANYGSAAGMNGLGSLYLNGQGAEIDYTAAKKWFLEAESLGSSVAAANIGIMYKYGRGVEKNFETAMGWFKKAADKGSSSGTYNIGLMHRFGLGVSKSYNEARSFLEASALDGNSNAMRSLGSFYEEGDGKNKDYEMARIWYEKSLEAGNIGAATDLGMIYLKGLGVPKDLDAAERHFMLAVGVGDTKAMNGLGLVYSKAHNGPPRWEKAGVWFKKAADAGDAEAMINLGGRHLNIWSTEPDYDGATPWFEKAAAKGHFIGMYYMALAYHLGLGVPVDYHKAVELFEKCASTGDPYSMNALGYIYRYGLGVKQDYRIALTWFERSAEIGLKGAMYNIGLLYQNGVGVKKNQEAAEIWFAKSNDGLRKDSNLAEQQSRLSREGNQIYAVMMHFINAMNGVSYNN